MSAQRMDHTSIIARHHLITTNTHLFILFQATCVQSLLHCRITRTMFHIHLRITVLVNSNPKHSRQSWKSLAATDVPETVRRRIACLLLLLLAAGISDALVVAIALSVQFDCKGNGREHCKDGETRQTNDNERGSGSIRKRRFHVHLCLLLLGGGGVGCWLFLV
ncbi:hypothetical protein BJ741DRAFT_633477 [Chytriomyces cf. hyalinus JEL632]|nr:hypothetical protein BJ741DRAFT_633477 [Chytriomyces cf. hyalinus JEL632]